MSARVVYKYRLIEAQQADGWLEVIPGEVVHVGEDAEGLACIWINGDPDAPLERRRFGVAPTGRRFPAEWRHLGTYSDHPFIWHVVELTP